MGLAWRKTTLLLFLCAVAIVPAGRSADAQQRDLLGGDALAEVYSPLSANRISDARWYGSVDALMLMRDSVPTRPYATLSSPTNMVLNSKDLENGFQAGPSVTLGRRLGDSHQVEFTWFDVTAWSDMVPIRDDTTNDLGGSGDLFSPFSNFGKPPITGLDYNSLVTLEFRSELYSMEMNLRQQLPLPPGPMAVTLLVGGRYLNVKERFGYYTESGTPIGSVFTNDVQVGTNNDLWGVQLGALLEFQVAYRSQITLDMKGGIYNNDASQSTIYRYTDLQGTQTRTGSRSQNVTAWVGELDLALTYQITPRITSHVGYQMVWIEGLAQGQGNFQSDPSILAAGPTDLNHDGHAIYHGPHVGLVLRL